MPVGSLVTQNVESPAARTNSAAGAGDRADAVWLAPRQATNTGRATRIARAVCDGRKRIWRKYSGGVQAPGRERCQRNTGNSAIDFPRTPFPSFTCRSVLRAY